MIVNVKPKFKVWWDTDEGILRNKAWGDFDEADARAQANLITESINQHKEKVLLFNDLSEAGKATSEARKIYADLMKMKKIDRQAFVGMRTMTRVIVSFIMNFSGVKNVEYFQTEEPALKWLKEDK
jgi:hypothetical protein